MNLSPFGKHRSPASLLAVQLVEQALDISEFRSQLADFLAEPKACKELLVQCQSQPNAAYSKGGDVEALLRSRAKLIDTLIEDLWCSLATAEQIEQSAPKPKKPNTPNTSLFRCGLADPFEASA